MSGLVIALGVVALAALGAVVRWQVGRLGDTHFPFGTLALNIGGAFVLAVLFERSSTTITLLGVGFLGSLTTFSTVMAHLIEPQRTLASRGLYLVATVVGGVAAATLGLQLA